MGKPVLQGVYGLDDAEYANKIGNMVLFLNLGCFAGVMLAGPITKQLGRILTLKIIDFLALVTLYCFTIKSLPLLEFSRFVAGFVMTMTTTVG